MTDPLRNLMALQQAMLEGWLNSTTMMMNSWRQILDMQEKLIHQAGEYGRTKVEIDDGPTFTGKYGKRRFDIDPERDV